MCIYVILGIAYGLSVQNLQLQDFLSADSIAAAGVLVGLALWYIAGTAFNDYADYEIDKINLKHDKQRPLVQGMLSRTQLLYYATVASLASLLIVAVTTNWRISILYVCMLMLNIAYSLKPIQISHRGGLAPLLLPLGYIVLTINSGILLTGAPYTEQTYLLVVAMYLHFMARIVLKDHRDVKGDAKAGKKTLILKYGNAAVVRVALALFVASTAILLSIFWHDSRNAVPFVVLLASGAVMALLRLSQETRWPYQKPLITVFGRFCSGVITLLIISLLPSFVHVSVYQLNFMLVLASGMFFVSIFDIIRLQHPGVQAKKASH